MQVRRIVVAITTRAKIACKSMIEEGKSQEQEVKLDAPQGLVSSTIDNMASAP